VTFCAIEDIQSPVEIFLVLRVTKVDIDGMENVPVVDTNVMME
jgi:hypothetical protein